MESLISVEETCTDFFVTGDAYMRDALDLKFIPRANSSKEAKVEKVVLGVSL